MIDRDQAKEFLGTLTGAEALALLCEVVPRGQAMVSDGRKAIVGWTTTEEANATYTQYTLLAERWGFVAVGVPGEPHACPVCGMTGVHACPGPPNDGTTYDIELVSITDKPLALRAMREWRSDLSFIETVDLLKNLPKVIATDTSRVYLETVVADYQDEGMTLQITERRASHV